MPIIFGEWLPVPEAQCRLPNELISAVGKWMPVQEALRQPKFGAKAKTKATARPAWSESGFPKPAGGASLAH